MHPTRSLLGGTHHEEGFGLKEHWSGGTERDDAFLSQIESFESELLGLRGRIADSDLEVVGRMVAFGSPELAVEHLFELGVAAASDSVQRAQAIRRVLTLPWISVG